MLKKRAHLAHFLVDINILPELLLEDDVNTLHMQFDILRDQFKNTHKRLEYALKKEKDSISLKNNVEDLEVEKNQIYKTIQKLKANLQVWYHPI